MIYELEPEELEREGAALAADGRLVTCGSYLKGLRHCDRPLDIMPKDALYLKAAKRFYSNLSETDKMIIDSFSDYELAQTLDLRKRNRRFKELCYMLLCTTGTESKFTILLPPERAEKGIEDYEPDQRNAD